MAFARLFDSIALGTRTLKNRIMQLPTGTHFHERGVGPKTIAFYEERAKGGVGSIVTGGMPVSPNAEYPSPARRDAIPEFERLAGAIHAHGALIVGQLVHGGRQHRRSSIPLLVAPSALACTYSGGTPHELEPWEIEAIVESFASCAVNLRDAGLDGVEVHAGQGHLIQQFLSPASNLREDAYGGDPERRMRFALEILREVRRAAGADFVVGLRLGVDELTEDGFRIEDARTVASRLAAEGAVDYISATQSNFTTIEAFTPDRRFARAPFVGFAAALKEEVPAIPVVACGRILEPGRAEEVLANGQADMIGLSRPLLADPQWAQKAENGDERRIRLCVSCNQCWGWTDAGREVGCIHNAACGNETQWGIGTLVADESPKRVVVIGGGPAGLESARVAAARGHDVVLFEERDVLGGALVDVFPLAAYAELGWIVDYLSGEIRDAGIEVRLGERATAESVLACEPDAVIVATGAVPHNGVQVAPSIPFYDYEDVLRRRVSTGRRAVVLDDDGYYPACAVAEAVAESGTRVTMVTRFFEFGREIPATSRRTTLRALDRLEVDMLPSTWIEGSAGSSVTLCNVLSGRRRVIENVDCVINAGARKVRDELYHELQGRVENLHLIGDAYMPRRIADAIRDGHRAGRALKAPNSPEWRRAADRKLGRNEMSATKPWHRPGSWLVNQSYWEQEALDVRKGAPKRINFIDCTLSEGDDCVGHQLNWNTRLAVAEKLDEIGFGEITMPSHVTFSEERDLIAACHRRGMRTRMVAKGPGFFPPLKGPWKEEDGPPRRSGLLGHQPDFQVGFRAHHLRFHRLAQQADRRRCDRRRRRISQS